MAVRKPRLTPTERDTLPLLNVVIPPWEGSHPFNVGQDIEKYTPQELRKVASTKQRRTDFFEKTLLAIWYATGEQAVPYAFKTADQSVRSLDAGCLGFLSNREPPEIILLLDEEGFIRAVEPAFGLIDRYRMLGGDRLRLTVTLSTGQPDAQSLAEEDEPLGFDPAAQVDDRLKKESLITIREGAREFRKAVLLQWESCALSGCTVRDALEAAHLHRYGGVNTNHLRNGIILRADIHRLFDRHLISLHYHNGDLVFSVSRGLSNSEYQDFDQKRIMERDLPERRPHPVVVQKHYEEFCRMERNRSTEH
ncbi:HNH endonuclease [Rhodobacter ferrooxidans]|uniref:HNH nuclease domain-containing protein n=1 Tax=Rhodobacter ferrooxidans TaxID=371731 RepID=C8S3P5_9RHOB|nr:HNH endonuclease [Rhodobacter sp. SW2]EEW24377.1 hypothetical protein Rsw2DRAFT_2673 [Rhodobacter sp. SW2]